MAMWLKFSWILSAYLGKITVLTEIYNLHLQFRVLSTESIMVTVSLLGTLSLLVHSYCDFWISWKSYPILREIFWKCQTDPDRKDCNMYLSGGAKWTERTFIAKVQDCYCRINRVKHSGIYLANERRLYIDVYPLRLALPLWPGHSLLTTCLFF